MDIITTIRTIPDDEKPSDTCDELEVDPAEYLFKEKKYHDWFITVGDPTHDITSTEKFGVVSSFLVSKSSFFRKMVATGKLVDTKNLKIANVSPAVFKLVLTFVYGGKLADVDRSTAAQLALTADSYKMADLVKEACKLLVPTCVEEVFPALWCVAYIHCPDLEPHVTKIIQEETKCVVERKEFLDLDSKCVEFIAKQEKLGVSELDLWKALVKWAQFKALTNPEKSARDHLENTLQFLRLTTLSQDEIVKEVISSKVLQPNEVLDLLEAVNNNKPWLVNGFCEAHTIRQLSERDEQSSNDTGETNTMLKDSKLFYKIRVFYPSCYSFQQLPEYQSISNLTIKPLVDMEISSFEFQSKCLSKLGNQPVYKLNCTITFRRIVDGFCKESHVVQVGGSVVGSTEIEFPLKLRNGEALVLEGGSWYNVALEFSTPHPAFNLISKREEGKTGLMVEMMGPSGIRIQYNTPLHVRAIDYKVNSK